jgi:hypothetical protein
MGRRLTATPLYSTEIFYMIRNSIFYISIIQFTFCQISAQENSALIGLLAGYSRTQVIDEYISKNEYSGSSVLLGGIWEDRLESRISEMAFYFNKIENLQFINSAATVYDFTTTYKYFYTVSETSLFNNPLNLFLGPGAGIYVHLRDQKFALSSKSFSFASLITADFSFKAELMLDKYLSIGAVFALSPFAFGGRSPSLIDDDNLETPVGFLTLFDMLHFNTIFSIHYRLTKMIEIKGGYLFRYSSIDKWQNFLLIQDNLILQTGVAF